MQKITPFLWFDSEAEEAANFYVAVFAGRGIDAKIASESRYGASAAEAAGREENSVMTVEFEIGGQRFVCLNGGPAFKFTEAISFMISCADQAEVDYYWEKLSAGGEEAQCGWLKDKFGLSWQVVPDALPELLTDPDPARASRAMQAMLGMKKLDIAALEAAAAG